MWTLTLIMASEAKLAFNRVGSFFCNFITPPLVPPDPAPPLSTAGLVAAILRLKDALVPPIVGLVATITAVLTWEHPLFTFCFYLTFVWLCYNPEYAHSAVFGYWAIRLLWGYPKATFEKRPQYLPPLVKEECQATEGMLYGTADTIISSTMSSLERTLAPFEKILHNACDGLDSVGDIPQGSFFSFTFAARGTFSYRNSHNSNQTGTCQKNTKI